MAGNFVKNLFNWFTISLERYVIIMTRFTIVVVIGFVYLKFNSIRL